MGSSSSPMRHAAPPAHPAGDPPTGCVFRREGDYWTVTYEGVTLRLRDGKGMHYVAHLLTHPGERIAAADLIATVVPPPADVATSTDRPRWAVTKRIKDAIQRITAHHPALGYHLATAVKTGSHCAYQPDPQRPLVWSR
jgi:hypothetical protein